MRKFHSAAFFILTVMCAASALAQSPWHIDQATYRVPLKLNQPINSGAVIAIDSKQIIDALSVVAVDPMDEENFAYEHAVLVNPRTGKTVGRFELTPVGEPIAIDGSFQELSQGKTPWYGYLKNNMSLKEMQIGGESRRALLIEKDTIANQKLEQAVMLKQGDRYLLEYWIMMDTQQSLPGVMLYDPSLTLFAQVPHSYINKLTPQGQWAHRRMLVRPRGDGGDFKAALRITHVFIGKAGVADVRLRPVAWRMVVNPDEATDELLLYADARAGHRYTTLTNNVDVKPAPKSAALGKVGEAERRPVNAHAVYVEGEGISAWTVAPQLPLKVETLASYKPTDSQRVERAQLNVFRGGSTSLVVAIDAKQSRIDNLQAETNLPGHVTFKRLARIPVYFGPHPLGDYPQLETRYDAMVPLDYTLDPDSPDGLHLLVATITAGADTPAGQHGGEVKITLGDLKLTVPVVLNVAPLTINPARHFGTMFSGVHILTRYKKGAGPFTEDSLSVAEFHGLNARGLEPPSVMGLSTPDKPSDLTLDARKLAEKYFHTMLDYHVQPESPALYAYFNYKIVEQGEGKAPNLIDWDFSKGYDEAIKEFVIGRDMPWLMVSRSNGYQMDKIRLNNGKTYSIKPNPDRDDWIHLSRDEFDKLVGDYWEHFALHLDELGLLDRAMFVIDESGPETFKTIRNYVYAMRSRPHAAQIKIGHTMYKPSAWTYRDEKGDLIFDDVIDVPMPDNDDEFNFFEPEWNARYVKSTKEQWSYYVETDHLNLLNAGLTTLVAPLKLRHFGGNGWYCWASFIWSMPYPYYDDKPGGFQYPSGPVVNPWKNPFYHHGPGVLSFFYPPDAHGPAAKPTDLIIPSYRLALMRDGIQLHALLDVIDRGTDDAGQQITVDAQTYADAKSHLEKLWAGNPVQWFVNYAHFDQFLRGVWNALE